MPLSRTLKDIESLKVQGAELVARIALSSIRNIVQASKADTKLKLLRDIAHAKTHLENSRPTEPCLRNVLGYVLRHSKGDDVSSLKESFLGNIQSLLRELENAESMIQKIGAQKIGNGMLIFTHCHSSTVMGILKAAKSQGKRFEVHNTETRPHLQGRTTSKELASHGIKVTHYVDSAARFALKKADLMLIGCDAFTSEGRIINKIGSELFAEAANRFQIPVYVCTTTWKFDPKTLFGFEEQIEKRARKEVWPNAPKNIVVDNHAFEIIDPSLVTAMITEIGIYRPEVLVAELRTRSTWLFE
jgi:eIF-2B alpha/beta/delta-like uncharacterized protein